MNQKEKESFKIKIQELILQLKEEISHLKEDTQPVKPENSLGRISRMDAINNKSVAEVSLRSREKKLSKLQIALRKVEKENFGQCSQCGRAIQLNRLMLLPESDYCVRCAAR